MNTTRPRHRTPIAALRARARARTTGSTTSAIATAGEQRRWVVVMLAAILLVAAAALAQTLGPVPAWVNIALWVATFAVGVGVIAVFKDALQ